MQLVLPSEYLWCIKNFLILVLSLKNHVKALRKNREHLSFECLVYNYGTMHKSTNKVFKKSLHVLVHEADTWKDNKDVYSVHHVAHFSLILFDSFAI